MSTPPQNEKPYTSTLSTKRLFLKELAPLDRSTLAKEISNAFKKYGKITEVFLPERSSKSYAFISFETAEAASQALREVGGTSSTLYSEVQPAYEVRNKRHAAHVKRMEIEWKQKFDLTIKSNVICQVHKSHVDRLIQFLEHQQSKSEPESSSKSSCSLKSLRVMGTVNPKSSRTASLIFVRIDQENVSKFIDWMENSIWFVRPVIHRIFQIDEHVRGSIESDVVDRIYHILCNHAEQQDSDKGTTEKISIRLHVFPPKLKDRVLRALDNHRENFKYKDTFYFTPKSATHSVGVIQVDDTLGPDVEGGLYGIGFATQRTQPVASPQFGSSVTNSNVHEGTTIASDGICRAYWKLQEVFDRYNHSTPGHSAGLTALDCGASPGGWTQFLSQKLDCEAIYSVDPGNLESSILQLPSVKHWPMTIQKALPKLKEAKVRIHIWVSDMCIKDTDQQVGMLLEALRMGIVSAGTFFVLTIKVIAGHSKSAFDSVVNEQVKRLEGLSEKIQKLHLFSNRASERTIVGYLI